MIDIQKHTLFTEEFYSFEMPNFEFWKKDLSPGIGANQQAILCAVIISNKKDIYFAISLF